jgi:hypothetical protein
MAADATENQTSSRPEDAAQANESGHRLVERRSRSMNLAGNTMAVFIALVFVGTYALRAYQLDFWGHSFYANAHRISAGCDYAALSTPYPEFPYDQINAITPRPVELPHGPDWFKDEANPQKILHVRYHCNVPRMADRTGISGVPTLHFGWIMSDMTEIVINGNKRLVFKGEENLSLALSGDEYVDSDLDIVVNTSGTPRRRFGLSGLIPMAIGTDNATNYKIRGLQMALMQITPLYTLLPLLTLAIVLAFAWFMGLKSRLIVVTFFYFSLNLVFNMLVLFGELTPWGSTGSSFLSRPFQIASWLAILMIGLELLQWFNRRILLISAAIVAALACEVGIIAFMKFPQTFIGPLWQTYRVIGMVGGLILLGVAGMKLRDELVSGKKHQRSVLIAFIALMSFYSLMLGVDFVVTAMNAPIKIGHYMELFLPLSISGLIFYTLAQIDRRLKAERERRAVMESELNLAAKLQDILLPATPVGSVCGVSYDIASRPLGLLGGDWIKLHATEGRAVFVLGDVVGKGPSAALTHSAIASAWEAHINPWSLGMISTEELLRNINETMFKLFHGAMNSTFAVFEIIDGKVRVACGGNMWILLDGKKPRPVGTQARALLGIKSGLQVSFQDVVMQKGDFLVTFTDGVLEGNRALKKFVTGVSAAGPDLSAQDVRKILEDAGAASVLPDDASSLILKSDIATVAEPKAPAAASM